MIGIVVDGKSIYLEIQLAAQIGETHLNLSKHFRYSKDLYTSKTTNITRCDTHMYGRKQTGNFNSKPLLLALKDLSLSSGLRLCTYEYHK